MKCFLVMDLHKRKRIEGLRCIFRLFYVLKKMCKMKYTLQTM